MPPSTFFANDAGSDGPKTSFNAYSDRSPLPPTVAPSSFPHTGLLPSAAVAASGVSGPGSDALGDGERRLRLDAMDPDAVRALAASMPVIEQAKGVLMGCFGVDPDGAIAILRRVSSARNIKLRDLAAVVVDAASGRTGTGQASGMSPGEQVRRALVQAQDGPQDSPSKEQDDGQAVRRDDEQEWS